MTCTKCKRRKVAVCCTACHIQRCNHCLGVHLKNVSHIAHKVTSAQWKHALEYEMQESAESRRNGYGAENAYDCSFCHDGGCYRCTNPWQLL